MRILIGNHSITSLGGSEEHARALGAEFTRQGHEVLTMERGQEAPIHDGPAFLSHMSVVREFLTKNPDSKCIQTIHGLVPFEGTPVRDRRVKHVAISQEIADAYKDLNCPVILNGIDFERFHPTRGTLPDKPEWMVSMAQSDSFNDMLKSICYERGMEFQAFNKLTHANPWIDSHMKGADIVVGIGRSAIEGAACGAMVIIADNRPYQPAWTDGILGSLGDYPRYSNYSGRYYKMDATREEMEYWISCYHPRFGDAALQFAKRYHDIKTKAREYMRVWRDFIAQ